MISIFCKSYFIEGLLIPTRFGRSVSVLRFIIKCLIASDTGQTSFVNVSGRFRPRPWAGQNKSREPIRCEHRLQPSAQSVADVTPPASCSLPRITKLVATFFKTYILYLPLDIEGYFWILGSVLIPWNTFFFKYNCTLYFVFVVMETDLYTRRPVDWQNPASRKL